MGFKKFLRKAKLALGLDDFIEQDKKKKSVKELLSKLHAKKRMIKEEQKGKTTKNKKKELAEELAIISLHIKNGKKLLIELYDKK